MSSLQIKDQVYKGNFTVFVGEYGDVEAHMRARGFDPGAVGRPQLAKTIEMEDATGGGHEILLWFRPEWDYKTPEGAGVLAHECFHAITWLLRDRRVSDLSILDEPGTYLMEWLVSTICTWADTLIPKPVRGPDPDYRYLSGG